MIEGIIKFNYSCISDQLLTPEEIAPLNRWRSLLFQQKFIGQSADGIGYGNISTRQGQHIIITASQTGAIPEATIEDYVLILGNQVDWKNLVYRGQKKPSSETQTHLSIYSANPQINTIFHVHHPLLWQFMLDEHFPQTSREIEYGTKEMAQEMIEIVTKKNRGIIVLAGHDEGIISYGENGDEAWEELNQIIQQYR